ncbi:MAG: hypothetical protein J0G37_02915 [Afipia sp.]|nr:hypothetical protein [Afipia sp.]
MSIQNRPSRRNIRGAVCIRNGYAVTNADREACATRQAVDMRQDDPAIIRTGLAIGCQSRRWETRDAIRETHIAAIRPDTRGGGIRSNETRKASRPLH